MFLHRLPRITPLACAVLTVACGGAHDATEKQLDELRSELVKLRADSAALDERVDALEGSRGGATRAAGAGERLGSAGASSTERGATHPNLEIVRLTPEPAEGDADADEGPRPVIRSTGKAAVVEQTAERRGEGQREYDQALAAFRARSFDRALTAFDDFLERFPASPNADSAVYWRGECHLAKANPRRAVEQFEEVVQRYPNGTKVPDALLKLALTYAKLGERSKSEDARRRLLTEFPATQAARKLAQGATPATSSGGAKPPPQATTTPGPAKGP